LFGAYAPAAMPAEVVARFNRELDAILARPATKSRFLELGADAVPVSPGDNKKLVRDQSALFRGIVRAQYQTGLRGLATVNSNRATSGALMKPTRGVWTRLISMRLQSSSPS